VTSRIRGNGKLRVLAYLLRRLGGFRAKVLQTVGLVPDAAINDRFQNGDRLTAVRSAPAAVLRGEGFKNQNENQNSPRRPAPTIGLPPEFAPTSEAQTAQRSSSMVTVILSCHGRGPTLLLLSDPFHPRPCRPSRGTWPSSEAVRQSLSSLSSAVAPSILLFGFMLVVLRVAVR
jgi:hypothetical protein